MKISVVRGIVKKNTVVEIERRIHVLRGRRVIPSIRSFGGALPYVFTREGISMLSGVLRSNRAVSVNVSIMRAFVRMGDVLVSRGQLAKKFGGLLKRLGQHEWKLRKHDRDIGLLMNTLRQILSPQLPPSKRIGF